MKKSVLTLRKFIYVSGRRSGTELESLKWLEEHEFPIGDIHHRPKGIRSMIWKGEKLKGAVDEWKKGSC